MKHLTIDAYNVPQCLLESRSTLSAILTELPTLIGMQRASEPSLCFVEPHDDLPESLTGFVIIYTSHIAFHAWPAWGLLSLDVFSCNDFEIQDVLDYIQKKFEVEDGGNMEINEVERAMRSVRDAMLASV